MSTVTHKPRVSNRQLVDAQIHATRRSLKLVDLLGGILTLTIGLLVFLFSTALLEHWVVPGGWSPLARGILFILLLASIAWYGWRTFWPLLRQPINPIYAAQTLEKSSPTLKNSLLSLLLFRKHRQQLSATVYQALEQQAALRLSQVPVDTAVDRSAILRLGYALVVVVAIFALYRVLSPKNPITSASRILFPWSSTLAPSRVQILDIRPGDTSVARGERLTISAEVLGLRRDEPVTLHYKTTMDGLTALEGKSSQDWQAGKSARRRARSRHTIPMLPLQSAAPTNLRWLCQLAGVNREGIDQNGRYWLEAGDARSATYQVRVFARPTMVVKRVRYDYPAYTGYPSREVFTTGDLDALEGTRVTLDGLSNQPIDKAFIDFDADGRHDLALRISADSTSRDRAQAQFQLTLRADRRTPRHTSYVMRFTTTSGRSNRHPPKYRIAVTPDYAPEIRLLEAGPTSLAGTLDHATLDHAIGSPEETIQVALNQQFMLKLEASDPDFALADVRVLGFLDQAGINPRENPEEGAKRLDRILLAKRHTGRFHGQIRFTPKQLGLHEGDELIYWAEARDNRTPEANVSSTMPRKLRVTRSQSQSKPDSHQQGKSAADPQQPGAGRPPEDPAADSAEPNRKSRQQPQDGNGEKGEGGEGGNAGGGGGDQESAEGESSGGGGTGENGAGAEGADNQGAEGEGAQSSDAAGPEQAGDPGADGRKEGSDQAGSGEEQETGSQKGANPSDSSSGGDGQTQADETPDSNHNNRGAGDQRQASSGEGQRDPVQEKVSPEGDDDGTAFDRLREHFAKQNAEPKDPADSTGQDDGPDRAADSDEAEGAQEPSDDRGQDGQTETPPGRSEQGQPKDASAAGAQGESSDEAQRDGAQRDGAQPNDAENDEAQEGQPGSGQNESGQDSSDNRQGAKGEPAKTEPEKEPDSRQAEEREPVGAPGEMSPEQGTPGAGDSQSGEQTTPKSQTARKPRDKQDEREAGERLDDQQPPTAGNDQQESNSQGGQGGDRTGGGQEGAGGQADAEGTGGAGQHEAADDGGGQSTEPGTGQTGQRPGDGGKADGQTGQSSQNQPGQGSKSSGQPGGQQPNPSQTGDNPPENGPPENRPPENGPGQKPDPPNNPQEKPGNPPEKTDTPQKNRPNANQDKPQGTPPPGGNGQPGQPSTGEANPDNRNPNETSGQPSAGPSSENGGGAGSSESPSQADPEQEPPAGDAANLDYARQQTDLILNRLTDQLNRDRVDPKLLDKLGWSQQDLQRFVNRWKNLESLAAGSGDQAKAAQAELNAALRSLGLRKNRRTRYDSNQAKDQLRNLRDTYRSRIPAEYQQRMRAYVKGTSQEGAGGSGLGAGEKRGGARDRGK